MRFPNVAIPAVATPVVVPDNDPPDGLVASARVIWSVALATVFPNASCTATCTLGAMEFPAVALDGCIRNASLAAAPGVTVNAELVADVRPELDATSV